MIVRMKVEGLDPRLVADVVVQALDVVAAAVRRAGVTRIEVSTHSPNVSCELHISPD